MIGVGNGLLGISGWEKVVRNWSMGIGGCESLIRN